MSPKLGGDKTESSHFWPKRWSGGLLFWGVLLSVADVKNQIAQPIVSPIIWSSARIARLRQFTELRPVINSLTGPLVGAGSVKEDSCYGLLNPLH